MVRINTFVKKKTKTEQNTLEFLELNTAPICRCGNPRKWFRDGTETPYGGYRKYCCRLCMQQSPETVNKRKNTMLERYGVDSYSKVQEFKPWSDETKAQYKERADATFIEKYGVSHHTKTPEYLEKREKTNLERYGVKNCFELVSVENRKPFFKSEAGKKWNREESKGKENFPKARERLLLSKIKDPVLVNIIVTHDKEEFVKYIHNLASAIEKPSRITLARAIGFSTCHLNLLFREYGLSEEYRSSIGRSDGEDSLAEFIESLEIDFHRGNRKLLSGYEIDIVIPSKKIGIEYNGIYWHSEGFAVKDSKYHLGKTQKCEELGYQLLQIYDVEWLDCVKRPIWESIIKAKCGLIKEKIYARKCEIRRLTSKEARLFLDVNHLDGFIGAKDHYGLLNNDLLVSVISFGQSRFNKKETEVIRFASLLNTIIIGGYSKLLKCFAGTLVSYANRRFSSILTPNAFMELDSITSPSWYGYSKKDYELKHRLSFTKQKLKNLFDYDENITAFDNMLANGYDRIWDSGHIKYIRM